MNSFYAKVIEGPVYTSIMEMEYIGSDENKGEINHDFVKWNNNLYFDGVGGCNHDHSSYLHLRKPL